MAFGYLAPITAFGYCFLANDVMESEGCAQRLTFCIIFKLKHDFPLLYPQCTLTLHMYYVNTDHSPIRGTKKRKYR